MDKLAFDRDDLFSLNGQIITFVELYYYNYFVIFLWLFICEMILSSFVKW